MIASKLHCSKTAVHTEKVNFMKYGNYKDRKRSGRPQKSTPKNDNMMKRIVARSSISSCQKIKIYLSQKGTEVSLKTIARRLCVLCLTEVSLKTIARRTKKICKKTYRKTI